MSERGKGELRRTSGENSDGNNWARYERREKGEEIKKSNGVSSCKKRESSEKQHTCLFKKLFRTSKIPHHYDNLCQCIILQRCALYILKDLLYPEMTN